MITLFDFLPIGAYQSTPSGRMLRANPSLVWLNGYDTEADLIAGVNDIAHEWYVHPHRREEFLALMERDGRVTNFVSEIFWHKSRKRSWINENAHTIRDDKGNVLYYEGTIEDISESHRAHLALERSEALLREMTAEVPGMLYRIVVPPGERGRYLFVSSGVRNLYRVEPDEVMADGAVLRVLRHPQDRAKIEQAVVKALRERSTLNVEFRIILKDGTLKWVQMASSFAGEDSMGQLRNGIMLDITERKNSEAELRNSESRWKLALESTGDGVWDWHIREGREYYSQRYKEMYGYSQDKVWQQSDEYCEIVHPDDKDQLLADQQAYFSHESPTYSNEHRVRCADGSWKWVLTRGMVIEWDAHGKPVRMIGTHTDITDRKQAEATVWRQAHFDPLTGLPNRRTLRERLESAIKRSQRNSHSTAVLFIDLDHFKEVNDTLGHDNGDMLLVEAAERIMRFFGNMDTVARMGGDEFTVVLNEVPPQAELEALLQGILDRLSDVFQLGNEKVFVSASMGIALYPQDATGVEDLFKHADQALYVAKGAGRNRYSFFTPKLQEAALSRLRLAADMRVALAANQFELAYQPIVNLANGEVRKAEALLRWRHPQRGMVSPAEFIGVAESNGLIVDIGEWVFRQAASQVQQWRTTVHPDFQISVNKSPVQFLAAGRKPWGETLKQLGLPGGSIAVEITEGLLMDATSSTLTQLHGLDQAGLEVSLDDFGTGYSSLTYLQKFSIDYIKIDQSFIRNLRVGATDLALCKAIIVMAHELGMKVVAEGVETSDQRNLLVGAGCDYGQGYLFARPMSAGDFERNIACWRNG
jgi:diguanylate cyclase (GGDEF)-like protein/PAS domain S-box-containing protein